MSNVIFVTGCCGYIGSHTCVELLNAGFDVVGIDNFSNSSVEVLRSIETITNKSIKFYDGDVLDENLLTYIFSENNIDSVIDFAAYKAVGESNTKPLEYYINNIQSVLTLLNVMKKNNVKNIVFSSSATVYGKQERMPITEKCTVGGVTNPYGRSKLFVEQILEDLYNSDTDWSICIFRYFNPVGAHETGLIGENPKGIPANIMPYITKVALGELEQLSIFGNDYDTVDGTGVRDYIHVVDLAKAHVKGVEKIIKESGELYIYNLGTGKGYSVFELIKTFEKVNSVAIKYKIVERRQGDIDICFADPSKAQNELNWKAQFNLEQMCKDAFLFEKKRINGCV